MLNGMISDAVTDHNVKFLFPLDILLLIIRDLDVRDVLSLGQCSRELAFLTNSRAVWHTLLQTQIISQHIPIPPLSGPLPSLSANELKAAVRRSILLRRAWTAPRPRQIRTLDHPPASTYNLPSALELVPGRGNRYALLVLTANAPVLSVASSSSRTRHLLQCIDFGGPRAETVAARGFSHPVHFAVNQVREGPAMLAAASTEGGVMTTYILGIDAPSASRSLGSARDSASFVTLAEFPTHGIPLLLSGDVLATGDQEGNVWVHDSKTGAVLYELRDPRAPHMNETVRVVLLPDAVLTFGYSTIKLFTLPSPLKTASAASSPESHPVPLPTTTDPSSSLPCPVLMPTAEHRWRWRLDSVTVCPLTHAYAPSPSLSNKQDYPIINILVRFGSWYPWPINMLHHFVLTPSSSSSSSPTSPNDALADSLAPSIPPQLPASINFRLDDAGTVQGLGAQSSSSTHPFAKALYAFPPTLLQYMASSVELFSVTDTALGPYGTALFTDSISDTGAGVVSAEARMGWQRVAGKMLRSGAAPSTEGGGGDGGEGGSESSSVGSMVFGEIQSTSAYLVAMDEEVGRVAVAWKNGSVSVWEYLPEDIV